MVHVVGVRDIAWKLLGLILPFLVKSLSAKFKRGLSCMTMNLSFSATDCLDGTGETLLRPLDINKKSLVWKTEAWGKVFIPSSLPFAASHAPRDKDYL
jgi:hypothetical protein